VYVCLCHMTCMCLYVCVIGDITYLQATLLAANFITDTRYLLTTLLPYHITLFTRQSVCLCHSVSAI